MNNHNWLVKLCSEQPVNETELEQALNELSPEQLMSLNVAPTPNADTIQDKVAFADQVGRELAQQEPKLLQSAEDKVLEQERLAEAVSTLTDEEAIKVAHILEHGTELEKKAFLGKLIGRVAKKVMQSGAGSKAMGAAVKNPNAALAVGGAAAGGLHSKATGGSFMGGAALGAGMGYGAGRLGAGKALQRGLMKAPGKLAKYASVEQLQKAGFMHMESHRNEWLEQFEGTPLLESALDMAKQELENEKQEIEERAARQEQFHGQDESWARSDQIRLGKRALELQLIEQRNGIGGGGEEAMPPEGAEVPTEEPAMPPGGADPAQATVESPAGQEAVGAIKEAATKMATSDSTPAQRAQAKKNHKWQIPLGAAAGGLGAGGSFAGAHKLLSKLPAKARIPASAVAGLVGGLGTATAVNQGMAAINRARHPEIFKKTAFLRAVSLPR